MPAHPYQRPPRTFRRWWRMARTQFCRQWPAPDQVDSDRCAIVLKTASPAASPGSKWKSHLVCLFVFPKAFSKFPFYKLSLNSNCSHHEIFSVEFIFDFHSTHLQILYSLIIVFWKLWLLLMQQHTESTQSILSTYVANIYYYIKSYTTENT